MKAHNRLTLAILLGFALALPACSVLQEDKIDYKSAKKISTLEVPPDLTQLARDTHYTSARESAASALAMQVGQGQMADVQRAAPLQMGDVQILREGDERWLLVNRSAQQLWEPVREFWLETGFNLEQEKMDLGIMETDWAENRAKLPQDLIRSALGRVFDSLYSTGERDRFRTRLESRPDGRTEIYITHRGMQEVYADASKESTIWQPRVADAELEVEFLRRLMVKLGLPQEQSRAVAATAQGTVPAERVASQVQTVDGRVLLQLDVPFDRAWRQVGLALDRAGFTVEDRDRSSGLYYVRYVEPDAQSQQEKQGWFSSLFSGKKETVPSQYRIAVRSQGQRSEVTVLDAQGQPETVAAQRILRVLEQGLK